MTLLAAEVSSGPAVALITTLGLVAVAVVTGIFSRTNKPDLSVTSAPDKAIPANLARDEAFNALIDDQIARVKRIEDQLLDSQQATTRYRIRAERLEVELKQEKAAHAADNARSAEAAAVAAVAAAKRIQEIADKVTRLEAEMKDRD